MKLSCSTRISKLEAKTQGVFHNWWLIASHFNFHAVRKLLDLFCLDDYFHVKDVLVAFVNVFLELGGKFQQFFGVALQVRLALCVGLFLHFFLGMRRDIRIAVVPWCRTGQRGGRVLRRGVAGTCEEEKQHEKENGCSVHDRPRSKKTVPNYIRRSYRATTSPLLAVFAGIAIIMHCNGLLVPANDRS